MKFKNLITTVCRASYANVWEAKTDKFGNTNYSIALLIPKSDTEGIKQLEQAVEACKIDFFGPDRSKWPKALEPTLRDGDDKDQPVYHDHVFLNAKSKDAPGIVNRQAKPILDQDEFYSGCYCRASISFYGYDRGKAGVGVGLNNLMKWKDGDRLDGSVDAETEFAQFADTTDDDVPDFLK